MKKIILPAMIFFAAFTASYIGLYYLVPGLRIKLAADAVTYFMESISFMVLFKSIVSFVIAAVLVSISFVAFNRKKKGL